MVFLLWQPCTTNDEGCIQSNLSGISNFQNFDPITSLTQSPPFMKHNKVIRENVIFLCNTASMATNNTNHKLPIHTCVKDMFCFPLHAKKCSIHVCLLFKYIYIYVAVHRFWNKNLGPESIFACTQKKQKRKISRRYDSII